MKKLITLTLCFVFLMAFTFAALADWTELIEEGIWLSDNGTRLTIDHEQLFHELGNENNLYWKNGSGWGTRLYKLVTNGKDLIYAIDSNGDVNESFTRYENITDERIIGIRLSNAWYNETYSQETIDHYYWQLILEEDSTFTLSCAPGKDVLFYNSKGFSDVVATGSWTLTDGKDAQLTLSSLHFLETYTNYEALENNPLFGCNESGSVVFSWLCIKPTYYDWIELELRFARDDFSMTLWKDDMVWNDTSDTANDAVSEEAYWDIGEAIESVSDTVENTVNEAKDAIDEAVESVGESVMDSWDVENTDWDSDW
ncbi:MAG: hypothetical protein IK127_08685 [Clostridia bacterium]|nr:hypothetical protein [Clostridia bacterium]